MSEPDLPRINAEPRLHVNTGAFCNNNCVFCAEGDRTSRARTVGRQTEEDLAAIMAGFPARDHVCFTTGEPTLSPLLPSLVRKAKELGYREAALITNGRRLAEPGFLQGLVDDGLDLVTVSVHGHCARLHDRLTRTPGSFLQTLRGLRQAARTSRVHTSTVLSRRNLDAVKPVLALLGRVGVEQAVLNVIKPRGRADRGAESLLPSHRDVARAVAAALAALGGAAPPVFLEDIPRCATEGLPASVRGILEHNVRYDLTEGPAGRTRYEEYDRARTEQGLRSKRSDCARCRYDDACPGPWIRYLEIHGWDGLEPVER